VAAVDTNGTNLDACLPLNSKASANVVSCAVLWFLVALCSQNTLCVCCAQTAMAVVICVCSADRTVKRACLIKDDEDISRKGI
jgi:hypothetical protein